MQLCINIYNKNDDNNNRCMKISIHLLSLMNVLLLPFLYAKVFFKGTASAPCCSTCVSIPLYNLLDNRNISNLASLHMMKMMAYTIPYTGFNLQMMLQLSRRMNEKINYYSTALLNGVSDL